MAPSQKHAKMPRRRTPEDRAGYSILARWVTDQGCPVTAEQIHNWVKRGLLPQMVEAGRVRGLPVYVQAIDTGRQALAACRYRQDLGELPRIAVQLFLDGYPCSEQLVLQGFQLENENFDRYAKRQFGNSDRVDFDGRYRIASTLAKWPEGRTVAGELPFTERTDLLQSLSETLAYGAAFPKRLREALAAVSGVVFNPAAIGVIGQSDWNDLLGNLDYLREVARPWRIFEPALGLAQIRSQSSSAMHRAMDFAGYAVWLSKVPSLRRMLEEMTAIPAVGQEIPGMPPIEFPHGARQSDELLRGAG